MGISIAMAQGPAHGLPFQLKVYMQSARPPDSPEPSWWPIDQNGDGLQELLCLRDERQLQVRVPNRGVWTTAQQYNLRGSMPGDFSHACLCGDLTGDGIEEIAVPREQRDSLWVDIYSTHQRLLELGPWPDPDCDKKGSCDGRRDSNVLPIGMLRATDGEPFLVLAASAGHDLGSRAILAYSLRTGEERWQFQTGANPIPRTTKLIDLDLDGQNEIVFTMSSPDNGRTTDLLDDSHAWLVVLDSTGRPRWTRRLGPLYHHPNSWDVFRPAGGPPLLVTCTSNRSSVALQDSTISDSLRTYLEAVAQAPDTLHVWDAREQRCLSSQGWESAFQCMIKIDEEHFVVTAAGGLVSLHELRSDGSVLTLAQRTTEPHVQVRAAADLDMDGRPELLGWELGWTPHLMVMDEHLTTLADLELYRGAGGPEFGIVHRPDGRPLLLAGISEHLLVLEYLSNPDYAAPAAQTAARTGEQRWLLLLLVPLAGAVIGFSIRSWRHRAGHPNPAPPQPPVGNLRQLREGLLLATDVGGHGSLSATKVIRRVIWLMEAVTGQPTPSPESLNRLRLTARDYREITLPQIEHILALGAALRIDAQIAQMVETACRSFGSLLTDLERAEWPVDGIREGLPACRATADRIEEGLQAIRRVARGFVTQPLLPEIESAVAAATETADAMGASIHLDLDATARACVVRASRGDLAVVLENLLVNALRAMRESRERVIRIAGRVQGRFAIIQIRDTGSGIPSSEWESVFEAGVSSRPGGGTGLYASRRLLEGLGGTLRVQQSASGQGTTMELKLLLDSPPETHRPSSIERETEALLR